MAYGNFIFSQDGCREARRAKGNGSDRTGHLTATRRPIGVLTAAIIAAALFLAGPAVAEPPLSRTARIVDGDTLEIAGQKVRLLGLDAPEGKQVCQREGQPWRCGDASDDDLQAILARAQLCPWSQQSSRLPNGARMLPIDLTPQQIA